MNELRAYLYTAIRAAQVAAHIHRAGVGSELDIKTKSTITDLVTRVDKEAEARIRELILEAYPDHVILGEEEGESGRSATHRWLVDPLDGTLNYAHGFPFYAVSIALEIEGTLQVGVILDSARNELFTAWRGGGAYLNGAPIAVSFESELKNAMLATGFSYAPEAMADNIAVFARMMPKVRAIRRPGSAALDLAYVACGRLDAFWEINLNPWDVAAGVLLLEEAGGRVSGPGGETYELHERAIVASNGHLHEVLLKALAIS